MVNKRDQGTNGRNIILNGFPMLLPKRILFRARHFAHYPISLDSATVLDKIMQKAAMMMEPEFGFLFRRTPPTKISNGP